MYSKGVVAVWSWETEHCHFLAISLTELVKIGQINIWSQAVTDQVISPTNLFYIHISHHSVLINLIFDYMSAEKSSLKWVDRHFGARFLRLNPKQWHQEFQYNFIAELSLNHFLRMLRNAHLCMQSVGEDLWMWHGGGGRVPMKANPHKNWGMHGWTIPFCTCLV